MKLSPLTVDGNDISPASDYGGLFPWGDAYAVSATIDQTARPNASPSITSISPDGRTIPLELYRRHDAAVSSAAFNSNVKRWFDPRRNSDGPSELVVTGDDGVTQLRARCYVALLEVSTVALDAYRVALVLDPPYFEATALTTSAANPATVTNAGTTPAYPVIELTTANHVTRRPCTVQAAAAGLPLIGYPVVFALADAGATASNTFVFVEGVSVPCYVDDAGLATSRVWALVDAVASRVTNVDILYGAGLVNPLCQTLNRGGMDWDDAANCANSKWEWNDWSTVSRNPPRPGVWRPAVMGNHNAASGATYAITAETSGSLTISIGAAGAFDNSADCIRLRIEGSWAGASSALANLLRATAALDGTNARAFVRYRVAGSTDWGTAWSTTANANVASLINVPNAVEIIIGLENHGATADPATLTIGPNASNEPDLTLAGYPTVVVGAAETMDRYSGTYQIGERSITFSDYMVPDGVLSIDCAERSMTSSVDGPVYWVDDALAIQFSHPDQWLVLMPGSNAVTDGLSATDTIAFRSAYS